MRQWKSKSLAAVLSLTMLFSTGSPIAASAAGDISGHWAENTISRWIDTGYISGYPDGSFRPDNTITRAEFTVLANRAFFLSDSIDIYFDDVPSYYWGHDSIATGVAEGYIHGDGNGKFRPDSPVLREEAAAMIAQIKRLSKDTYSADGYSDSYRIPEWAKGYIGAVSNANIMSGFPDGSFKPDTTMTRAEAVAALDRALDVPFGNASNNSNNSNNSNINYNNTINTNTNTNTTTSVDYTLSNTTLEDKVVTGDLIIPSSMSSKNITLKNVTVKGQVIVKGGSTITADRCELAQVVLNKQNVNFKTTNKTTVKEVNFQTDGKITGTGYSTVTIEKSNLGTVSIDATVDYVYLDTDAKVKLLSNADINRFEASSKADNTTINFSSHANVDKMDLHDKVRITGSGDIGTMTVYEDGVQSSIRPDTVKTSNGADKPTYTKGSSSGGHSSSSSSRYDNLVIEKGDSRSFDGDGDKYNNVRIELAGARVYDMVVYGDLTIDKRVGNGEVTLEDIEVRGDVYVYGGGENSIVFDNCDINGDIVSDTSDKDVSKGRQDDPVALKFYKSTDVDGKIRVKGNTIISPYRSGEGASINKVVVENALNDELEINLDVSEVILERKNEVAIGSGAKVTELTINSSAANSTINLRGSDSRVTTLKANAKTELVGNGRVDKVYAYKDVSISNSVTANDIVYNNDIKVTGVSISPSTLSVKAGSNGTLKAVIAPTTATNKNVTWSSNDTTIATVTSGGVVTGVKEGTATITATTKDGAKTATCIVSVTKNDISVTGVTVSPTSASVKEGARTTITATVSPSDATNKAVTWSSNDTAIATVTASGVVTGVKEGSATITATTADGNKTAICNVQVTANKIDTSSLKTAITNAEAAKNGLTTINDVPENVPDGTKYISKEVMDTLNKAIAEAEKALETVKKEEDVKSAVSTLNTAVSTFNGKIQTGTKKKEEVNKTELKNLVDETTKWIDKIVESTDGNDVDTQTEWMTKEDKAALTKALADAKAVLENDSATQKDVTGATTALQNAVDKKKHGEVNKSSLESAITEAEKNLKSVKESVNGSDIETTDKWVTLADKQKLESAITDAKETAAKHSGITTQAVEDAKKALDAATKVFNAATKDGKKGQEASVDKTALNSAITAATTELGNAKHSTDGKELPNGTMYVEESAYQVYQTVLKEAKAVADNAAAIQADIDAALKALTEAQTAFNKNITTVAVDYTVLDDAIKAAEEKRDTNGSKVPAAKDEYDKAIKTAIAVKTNKESQNNVAAAITELDTATKKFDEAVAAAAVPESTSNALQSRSMAPQQRRMVAQDVDKSVLSQAIAEAENALNHAPNEVIQNGQGLISSYKKIINSAQKVMNSTLASQQAVDSAVQNVQTATSQFGEQCQKIVAAVEQKAQQEVQKKAEEEAALRAKQAAEKKAEEEAALIAKQAAEKKAEEEAALIAQQEAEKKAEEEAALRAQQETQKKAEQEAALKAQQPVNKSVSVGISGSNGNRTNYSINTVGINIKGAAVSLRWQNGTAPMGVAGTAFNRTSESTANFSLSSGQNAVPGTYYFNVSVNGVLSPSITFVVNQ